MPNFKVYILEGPHTKEIGSFTYNHTVLQVKKYYYETINNSVPVNQLRFQYGNKEMENDKTLGYYDSDVEPMFGMVICLLLRMHGGGDFELISGPDVNAKVKKSKWNLSAPNYRVCKPGFAIEWIHDGKKVIGNLGFGTFEMNKSKSTKKAYCKGLGIYYDGVSKITEYWFNNCKVEFEGELPGSKPFNKKKTFGDMACRFEGGAQKKKYRWLDITVKKL